MPPPAPGESVRCRRPGPRRSPAGCRGCGGQRRSVAPARSLPPEPGGLLSDPPAGGRPIPAPPGHWPGRGYHRRWRSPPGAVAAGLPPADPLRWRGRQGCRGPQGVRAQAAAGFPAAAGPHRSGVAAGAGRWKPSLVLPALPVPVPPAPRPPQCGRRRTPPTAGRPWRHRTFGSSRSPPGGMSPCQGCGCPRAAGRHQRWPLPR